MCVFVCVCERGSERERDESGEKDILAKVFREFSLRKDIKYVTDADKKLCDDRFK